MSAQEPAAAVAKRSEERPPSMRDLLASCAAADAVSTPPKAPGVDADSEDEAERDAA
ncbi:hypothetical protein ACH4U6_18945 [Streptomyces netropsis]|uniref:Uncharacterized protein n=1 Tax=Streptomyces netropsis TaxID=55404 RepID=A0A7W7LC19_STRNE|nr:hypothetical protein [Streptomyces netropsis]MBB4886873.1 hypothetical protein [Streptomyces netropsis]GGR23800.1 hypothetical protein GCM10010219_30680 [Streptomyces netropsis]